MIRTLDGQVRAGAIGCYRRLDNFDLAENVLPILQRLEGARFESVELTETKMYLKVITPRVEFDGRPRRHRAGRHRHHQLGSRLRRAVGAAADLPAGVQERSDRIGSCAAQDACRARAGHGSGVDQRVPGTSALAADGFGPSS
jgi:hypothetical protein